jgi:spore coat protein F
MVSHKVKKTWECETVETEERTPKHLAWHETLELHELVAFQSAQLIAFKKKLPMVQDPALHALYAEAIQGVDQNLRELLQFYPQAPAFQRDHPHPEAVAEQSGQLLGFAKSAVRSYAWAITETATPQLRETFERHLHKAIRLHGKVFAFLYERGLYPAYDLAHLLANDVKSARTALSL